jgi:hypothetical protein
MMWDECVWVDILDDFWKTREALKHVTEYSTLHSITTPVLRYAHRMAAIQYKPTGSSPTTYTTRRGTETVENSNRNEKEHA